MNVTRVHTSHGSHIEPPLEEEWDDYTKLRWHAAVVTHDTGLAITVHPHTEPGRYTRYGITIGKVNEGGQTSLSAGSYTEAWRTLNHIRTGAQGVAARVRQLHRPVEHGGQTICAECSAYGGQSTDNAPIAHPCATVQAIGGEQS